MWGADIGFLALAVKKRVQNVNGGVRLDSYTRFHSQRMDLANQFRGRGSGIFGHGSGFLVEAVEVAPGFFEVGDPFLGLSRTPSTLHRPPLPQLGGAHLGNHHVAVKHALAPVCIPVYRATDAGDDGSTDGNVRHEMAVHNIYVEPICAGVMDDA